MLSQTIRVVLRLEILRTLVYFLEVYWVLVACRSIGLRLLVLTIESLELELVALWNVITERMS